ncbi:MAG TPA: BON domain-containing protein [Dongiaceae bacterium]|nr:BON domain-containing protein [Dongiaceae bacterium]
MESDLELNKAVLAEIEFEPSVNLEDIGVSVREGIVTLTGSVSSYDEKLAATRAAKRVAGVRGLAEDILVKLTESSRRADSDIAAAAVDAIKWMTTLPTDSVKITVRDGWLSLEGAVGGWHQKRAAEEAVRNLAGVQGVTNLILIEPAVAPGDMKGAIEAAFERHAPLDARQIRVDNNGGKVVLRGNVRSFIERDEAERAAWAAPGVSDVENRIVLII